MKLKAQMTIINYVLRFLFLLLIPCVYLVNCSYGLEGASCVLFWCWFPLNSLCCRSKEKIKPPRPKSLLRGKKCFCLKLVILTCLCVYSKPWLSHAVLDSVQAVSVWCSSLSAFLCLDVTLSRIARLCSINLIGNASLQQCVFLSRTHTMCKLLTETHWNGKHGEDIEKDVRILWGYLFETVTPCFQLSGVWC